MALNNTHLQRFPANRERKAIRAADKVAILVNRGKDRWALKKVELDLMEASAGQEMHEGDLSLDSQAADDLVPYEVLDAHQQGHAAEVLPGWYARGK